MQDFPETPEAVALALLRLILESGGAETGNILPSKEILDLYRDCLAAAFGLTVAEMRRIFH